MVRNTPLISVIIPLYNKEMSIKKTICSVLNQEYENFELLIIDDGSTDKSLEIVSAFDDNRLTIISKKNGGVSSARNLGIKKAIGEFIFFLDADDLIKKKCLSVFEVLTSKHKDISIFVSNYEVLKDGKVELKDLDIKKDVLLHKPLKSYWSQKIFPRTGCLLIKKQCFNKVAAFDTRISLYEDLDLIIRLFREYSIVYSYQSLFIHLSDYNELSKNAVSVYKTYAYYIELHKYSFYEKLLKIENVYNTLQSNLSKKDKRHLVYKKYSFFYFFGLIFFVKRKSLFSKITKIF